MREETADRVCYPRAPNSGQWKVGYQAREGPREGDMMDF
jgi:hypothetical protein